MPTLPEAIIWTGADSAALARAVLAELTGVVQPIAVGGPRQAAVHQLASDWNCPYADDSRKLIVDHPAAFLFLPGSSEITPAALVAAVEPATAILHVEPVAATLRDCSTLASIFDNPRARFVHVPDLLRSTGWIRAADPLLAVGAVRSLAYLGRVDGGGGSLASCLHEAARLTLRFCDLPLTIDAHIAGPGTTTGGDASNGGGHLTAHARLPGGRGAVWMVSHASPHRGVTTPSEIRRMASQDMRKPGDPSGETSSPPRGSSTLAEQHLARLSGFDRVLHLIGDEGRLQLSDDAYELSSHEAGLIDRLESLAPRPTLAGLIARQWRQLIDRPALLPPGPDSAAKQAAVVACCQAALLSARTGQPESPGQLLETHGWR